MIQEKQKVTGGDALMMSLIAEGVDTIFGYPGGQIMPIYNSVYHFREKIRHILVRHEQGAAHAARTYSQTSGRVGVCFATSGPGATNLITGIADAMIDSVPMVCITGQVGSKLLGTDAFQETDVIGISMPVTKWSYQVTKPEKIAEVIAKAFYIARTGRPGPVLIDICRDAQVAECEYEYKKEVKIRSYHPYPTLDKKAVQTAAMLINDARKPMMLIGHGIQISGAEAEVMALAQKASIPVGSTLMGLGSFPKGHRLYVGMLGMHGNYCANIKTNEADLLIAVGMRFDDRVTGDLSRYAKQAKIIHIDIDAAELNKNVKVNVPILCDAKTALKELIPLVNENSHNDWLDEFRELDKLEYEKVIQPECYPTEGKIRMGEVMETLSKKSNGNTVICTDVGQHQMMAARYFNYVKPHTFITSGGLGTMGFGLPAAIGAKYGDPSKHVVAIIGDGGFQMTIQELGTIQQFGAAVKIIILNNSYLGMVRQWQELFWDEKYSEVDIMSPDFIAIGKAYGIQGKRVSDRAELSTAIDEMLASKETYIMEVEIEKEANVFPMVPPGASVAQCRLE